MRQLIHLCMMDHAIGIRGSTDLSLFGFINEETAIRAGPVGESAQFILQLQQFVFRIEVECCDRRPETFAFASLFSSSRQSFKRDDIIPEIAVSSHDLSPVFGQPPISLPFAQDKSVITVEFARMVARPEHRSDVFVMTISSSWPFRPVMCDCFHSASISDTQFSISAAFGGR